MQRLVISEMGHQGTIEGYWRAGGLGILRWDIEGLAVQRSGISDMGH